MATADIIRNELIGKLLSISNKEILIALNKIVDNTKEDKMKFTKEQELMFELSEKDLKAGRVISNAELNKQDLEWLKKL